MPGPIPTASWSSTKSSTISTASRARSTRRLGSVEVVGREGGGPIPGHDPRGRLHGRRGLPGDKPLRQAERSACAERVPDSIVQIHSVEYRNPAALPQGAVVVVGSGQSGAQIAEDLHLAGRKVHLVTGNAPRCARFYRGRDVVDWLWDIGQYAITVADDGMGHKRHDTNHYLTGRDGGRDIDLRAFAKQGMSLYGRLRTVAQGQMLFEPNLKANLDEADRVYNGINALIDRHIAEKGIAAPAGGVYVPSGSRPRSRPRSTSSPQGWRDRLGDRIHARLVLCAAADLRRDRLSVHRRGVTSVPGAYVLGLPWLWTWGSGRSSASAGTPNTP